MENKKKLRCPLGVPGGIIATLIGLIGIIINIINFDLFNLLISFALFLLGAPFVRVTMMIHSANDRLDDLEQKIK
jgi:multisubunit Na+/H+ antiporter MnhG subunit